METKPLTVSESENELLAYEKAKAESDVLYTLEEATLELELSGKL